MENLVTIEQAKILKELGFIEKTHYNYYTSNIDNNIKLEKSLSHTNWNNDEGKFSFRKGKKWSAPTIEQMVIFLKSINQQTK